MTMVGVTSVKEIGRHHLAWVAADGLLVRLDEEFKGKRQPHSNGRALAKL